MHENINAPIPKSVRAKLPKASWLHFCWSKPVLPGRPHFFRSRLANAMRWQVGNLVITHRAPWLPYVARANHPHLFKQEPRHDR